MPLQPGYGETPLSGDELDALLAHVVDTLGPPVSKADIFDLESAILQDVAEGLITDVFNGDLTLDELLTDQFLRDLHRQLYGDIWTWAGRWRSPEINLGVAPEQIAVDLRTTMDNIRYRWGNTKDWTARELGIAAHAEGVRVHPFTDGNGRATRLHADLCSSPPRIPPPISTTGTSTSGATSNCSETSTGVAMSPI